MEQKVDARTTKWKYDSSSAGLYTEYSPLPTSLFLHLKLTLF